MKILRVSMPKLDIVLARQCKSLSDLRNDLSPGTLLKVRNGEEVRTKTIGRLAKLLDCDPADIIQQDKQERGPND